MEKTEREILRADEAASLLKISRWSLYQKVRRREIPAYQQMQRGHLFFFKDELINYIEGMRLHTVKELEAAAKTFNTNTI